jgi:hypothetical protein
MRSRMKKWPWVDVVAATPAAADSRDVQAELGLSSRTTPLMAHPTLSRWDLRGQVLGPSDSRKVGFVEIAAREPFLLCCAEQSRLLRGGGEPFDPLPRVET